jgi:branched-chain amino acid transport system substrate-binding protein
VLVVAVAGCGSSTTTTTGAATTGSTAGGTATTAAAAGGTDTLKIGAIMPLTGPLAVPSLAITRGWQIYADTVNAAGGVKVGDKTYKVEFVTEDSKGTAEGAATAANKLVTQDKVQYVIGAMLEDEVAAIYGVTQPAGVLYGLANINIPGHASDVSKDHPLEVRLSVSPDDNQGLDLDYILKNYPNAKKIAISAPGLGYDNMIARLKDQAAKRGMEVVYTEVWPWGTTDFVPTMTKINASNPDIIFAMNSGQATDQLKAARSLGFKGPFVSNSPLGADVFVATQDPSILNDVIVNSPDVTHPTEAMKPIMDAWAKNWPNDPFISDAVHAYDMPWVLVQAMQKAGSLDPTTVQNTLETMTNPGDLKTNEGNGYMSGLDRFGVNRVLYRPFPITILKDGKEQFEGYFDPVE